RAQDEAEPLDRTNPPAEETSTSSPPSEEPAEPKTYPPFRRVPNYFAKVGLSEQQRSDIYIIRGRYQAKIAELKLQIEQMAQEEMSECESLLTESQRKLLVQLRDAARPRLSGNDD